MMMELTNGCMTTDLLYTAIKMLRMGEWSPFGLADMATKLDRLQKMDADGMSIMPSDTYDATDLLEYNARGSNLNMCEHLCA